MASLTATKLPNSPIFTPKIVPKSHQFTQFLTLKRQRLVSETATRASSNQSTEQSASSSSPGLYSAKKFELTAQNVDLVLEDVRPYLIADGGNVDVVSVQDGVVSLQLQGRSQLFFFFFFSS